MMNSITQIRKYNDCLDVVDHDNMARFAWTRLLHADSFSQCACSELTYAISEYIRSTADSYNKTRALKCKPSAGDVT